MIFYKSILVLVALASSFEANARQPEGHIFFEDTCMGEPASVILPEWLKSKTIRSANPRVIGSRTKPARVRAKVNIVGLDEEKELYIRVELLEHGANDLSERVVHELYEKKINRPRNSVTKQLSMSSLPLNYRAEEGRLMLRLTWIQGDNGGVRSQSLVWRDPKEDFFRTDGEATCYWQDQAQLRSGYRYNSNASVKTLTERIYVFRNFGAMKGLQADLSSNELESYYNLNRPSLSDNEINALNWNRPLQGMLPTGVGGWFSSHSRNSEYRQDTMSLFQTYILSKEEGGYYVSRNVFARHKALRYCFVNNSCGGIWRLCERGELDVGVMVKGFTIVPQDVLHDPDDVMRFVEAWNLLQDSCELTPKNSNTFEYINRNLDEKPIEADEAPILYFKRTR